MKRLLKRVLKAIWGITSPIRRPILRKFDGHTEQLLVHAMDTRMLPLLSRIVEHSRHVEHVMHASVYDTNLVLNSLVREVARLQIQVEALQQVVQERNADSSGLSIVGESDEEPCQASA